MIPIFTLVVGLFARQLGVALNLIEKDRLAKVFKSKEESDREMADLRKDLAGVGKRVRLELDGMGRRVDASDAKALLAVNLASEVKSQIGELQRLIEVRFKHLEEKMDDRLGPSERHNEMLGEMTRALSVQAQASDRETRAAIDALAREVKDLQRPKD